MCTEVAEKVDEAAELGPRIHTWELGPDKPEFDRNLTGSTSVTKQTLRIARIVRPVRLSRGTLKFTGRRAIKSPACRIT
jgi:hypothetical protein